MTSFSFCKYFDAFELDVNVVNFVYYGKTRIQVILHTVYSKIRAFINVLFNVEITHQAFKTTFGTNDSSIRY